MHRLFREEGSYFAGQADGFLHGHLYLTNVPDPRLTALKDPYDPNARIGGSYLWDASYFRGRYYLYFSPVPVLLFYIPYRLVRGSYPPDLLATLVFAIWAFLATVFATRRALLLSKGTADDRRQLPLTLWILLIGFGTLIPFSLAEVRIYEVSAMAGAAMTAMWAWSLVRMIDRPASGRIAWMALWLALSIAARPNLGVLLFVAAITILAVAKDRATRFKMLRAAFLPLAVVGSMMLLYNAGRFGKILEFGTRYQLTAVSMKGKTICRLCNLSDVSRLGNSLIHYVFWPVSVRTTFPFLKLERADLDPAVSFPGNEEVMGMAPMVPLTLVATLLAAILALTRNNRSKGTLAGLQLMLAAWLIIFGLSTCWYVVARYELDFMLLIVTATIVCIESGLAFLRDAGVRVVPLRIATAIFACYSIAVGLLLGFVGHESAFRKFNPDLFYRVASWLGI